MKKRETLIKMQRIQTQYIEIKQRPIWVHFEEFYRLRKLEKVNFEFILGLHK